MRLTLLPIFLMFLFHAEFIFSKMDSTLVVIDNIEDLLPAEPSENLSYDYLEEINHAVINIRSRYIGNSNVTSPKLYNRVKAEYNGFSAGAITEKDPAEKSLTDFYSWFVSFSGDGLLKKFIAGNYTLSFGNGLATSTSFRSIKTSDIYFPLNNNSTAFKPFLSTDENKFYRGLSLTLGWNNFSFSPFFSNIKFDAQLDSNNQIISIPLSGNHITPGELLRKNRGSLISAGIVGEYNSEIFRFGILFANSRFGNNLSSILLYRKNNNFISTSYEAVINKKISVSGENATDLIHSNHIITANLILSKEVGFITAYRNYHRDFTSYYGNAFGESYNRGYDENGMYAGVKVKISPLLLDIYFDQYNLSGIKEKTSGEELLVNARYTFANKLSLKLKYRSRSKELLTQTLRRNISAEFSFLAEENIRETIKAEYIYTSLSKDEGYMVYNNLAYKLKNKLDIYFRITYFRTSSSDAALYEYENDLPGMFSSRRLSGEGIMYYFMASYQPFNFIKISIKYSSLFRKESSVNYLNFQTDLII